MGEEKRMDPPADFEIVDHTADWAIRVWGRDFRALLLNAAWAVNSLLVSRPETVPARIEKQFALEAIDRESLLVEWLSELAYFAEMEGLVFSSLELPEVSSTALSARVRGDKVQEMQKHIKAVTYHNLAVTETERGLETTVVLDV
jgi:SHS2 domain-containing protein